MKPQQYYRKVEHGVSTTVATQKTFTASYAVQLVLAKNVSRPSIKRMLPAIGSLRSPTVQASTAITRRPHIVNILPAIAINMRCKSAGTATSQRWQLVSEYLLDGSPESVAAQISQPRLNSESCRSRASRYGLVASP